MIRGVDDDVLSDITGDDGALGGGTIVMLDGETRRRVDTRRGVAMATNCQRRLQRYEVRRVF